VLTRLPIVALRPLVAVDDLRAALLVVEAEGFGRPLVILLVDMPSEPMLPRMELALRLARLLRDADAPAPDLVVGDLNITRGSASLGALFSDLRHAYDEAGHGYGASFHRRFPLYHIDHMLLGPTIHASRYDLIDTGVGRHRVQMVHLVPRSLGEHAPE
jgi:endonuclease/exonuclease/phosphatase family metal-dependent hydrolase